MKINFVKVDDRAILPTKAHPDLLTGDAAFDLFAIEDMVIPPRDSAIVPTGLQLGFISPGYWFKIEGRSGLGFKHSLLPHPGVIDNGYRGDMGLKIYNFSDKEVVIKSGQAAAQIVIYKMIPCTVGWQSEVSPVDKRGRGIKGFGSSDKMNKKIKISHEVPMQLLEVSRQFNDYDYALVHLFESNSAYYDFFVRSLEAGREVILDNSIFELGVAFDPVLYAGFINKLRPTKYIIPDVWGKCNETIARMHKWKRDYPTIPGITMGVVQGETYEELTKCYKEMAEYCDEIAICFHYKFYGESLRDKMIGRQQLIQHWLDRGIINTSKKHHLLGCSLPQEFSFYKNMSFINSIDTSNPIVHGMKGIRYHKGGLNLKQSTLLADLMDVQLAQNQLEDIQYNINEFRKIIE